MERNLCKICLALSICFCFETQRFGVAAEPSIQTAQPPSNFLEDNRIMRLEGFAKVLGSAGACEIDVEPVFRRILAWTEVNFQENANNALDEHFFPVFQEYYAYQKQNNGGACDRVKEIYRSVIWP